MNVDLLKDYEMAKEGREIWIKLKDKYSLQKDFYLVVFPDDQEDLNKEAMCSLPEFLRKKYINKALVLLEKENIHRCKEEDNQQIYFEILDKVQLHKILKYYRLVQFTKNIVVISLQEPYGNGNIIGKKGITLIDYVKDAIYV